MSKYRQNNIYFYVMETYSPTQSPAENKKRNEKNGEQTKSSDEIKDVKINEYLGKALMTYKNGNKGLGYGYLYDAINEATKKGITIPLETIEAITEGRAPGTKEGVLKPHENQEKTSATRPLEAEQEDIHKKIMNNLEPWRIAMEKKLTEIIEEIRKKFGLELEISPELVVEA